MIGVGKNFFQRSLEIGPVVSTILCVAQREAVDLIAMASRGRNGLSRAFYGSTDETGNGIDHPHTLVVEESPP